MLRLFLILCTIAALTLVSCSSTIELDSQVTVLDHSSCDSEEGVLIKLEATGGTAPYVYTLWDQSDNSQIHSIKSDENVVIVGKKDLLSIDYKYVVTDSDGVQLEVAFKITPAGSSIITSQLTMQNDQQTILPEGIEVQLMKIGAEGTGIETTYTDSEGKYLFRDLKAGNYSLEVILNDKYDDYILLPKNTNTKLRVERGTHNTLPFSLACNENFEADLLITN